MSSNRATVPIPRPDRGPVTRGNPPAAGRGTLLTPEMHDAFVEGMARGNYVSTVCDSLGIARDTYYTWRRKGKPVKHFDTETGEEYEVYPDSPYGRLVQALKQAEAKAEMTAVDAIRNHFDSDWRAPAEFLSRRHGERWNPKQQIEMSGKVNHVIEVTEQRQALYAKLDLLSIERDEPEEIEAEILEE